MDDHIVLKQGDVAYKFTKKQFTGWIPGWPTCFLPQ